MLARPISAAFLGVLLVIAGFADRLPPFVLGIAGLVGVVPVLRLLLPIVGDDLCLGLYGLAAWYAVDWIRDFLLPDPLTRRIVLLLESLAVAGMLGGLLRPARLARLGEATPWLRAIGNGVRVAVVALAVAVIANAAGNVSLADLFVGGTLAAAYVGILVYAGVRVLGGLYAAVLRTSLARSLRMVRHHTPLLHRRGMALLHLAGVVFWALLALRAFRIRDPILDVLGNLLTEPLSIGGFAISLGDLLAFVLTVWVSFLVARFVRFALEEDVLSRAELPRGVSFAISSLVRYAIVLIGLLIATAAAGFDMSRLALIIGALG